jgi:DNA-binding beta-propeller fold protein YncE
MAVQQNSDDLTEPCPKHGKEVIKFYCNDHQVILCRICVSLKHSGTCKVNYIPDISEQVINSQEYQDMLKAMETASDQFYKRTEDIKKITAKSDSSLTEVLADIKKFRQEVNHWLDELEKAVEDEAIAIQEQNEKNLKTVERAWNDISQSMMTSFNSIQYLNTSEQADKLFMELKLANQMIEGTKRSFLDQTDFDLSQFSFKPSNTLSSLLKEEKSLGEISGKNLNKKGFQNTAQIKSRHASHQGEICVKTSADKYACCITGMTVFTPDLFIITDETNNAVKLVDTSSQSVADQVHLEDQPHDITMVTGAELAVTLPAIQTIQFLSVSKNKLQMKHNLKVDGKCHGISCYQGKLVVSFCNPAKFMILDRNGTVLKTLQEESILSHPVYVKANESSIYVSDSKMRSVTRFNWQGEVTGSYGDLGEPRGMALSDDGTVYACDWQGDDLVEISEDCSMGKVIKQHHMGLEAICSCPETSTVYLSCSSDDESYNNFLQVYKLD